MLHRHKKSNDNIGNKFNIKPGCPNLIDRIEAGLLSYGNEFTIENNPTQILNVLLNPNSSSFF